MGKAVLDQKSGFWGVGLYFSTFTWIQLRLPLQLPFESQIDLQQHSSSLLQLRAPSSSSRLQATATGSSSSSRPDSNFSTLTATHNRKPPTANFKFRLEHNLLRFGFYTREGVYK